MARIDYRTGSFNVELGLDELRDFERFSDQFPFAISLAMNLTAKHDAVPAMREGLYQRKPGGAGFTDRGVKYTAGGIQFYEASTKSDLTVKVGAISEYLLAASQGAADNSRPMGRSFVGAVPIGPTRDPKTTRLAKRNDWPMQLIKRGLAYRPGIDRTRKTRTVQVQTKSGKTRNRKVNDKPEPLMPGQVLYGTKKSSLAGHGLWFIADDRETELKPAYPTVSLVKDGFTAGFSDNLYKAIRKAIRTSNKQRRAVKPSA